MIALLFLILGLFMGSFLLNYAERYGGKRSVWRGRSKCPRCSHVLEMRDLVPLASFALSRGRCRHCGKRIPWRYPVAELVTGGLYLLVWLWLRPDLTHVRDIAQLGFYLYLASVAVVLTAVDLRLQLLPDRVLRPAGVAAGVYLIYQTLEGSLSQSGLLAHVATGLGAGGAFLALVLVSRGRWMGMGDVKLVGLIGLVVGWPYVLVSVLIGFWSAAIPSVLLLVRKRRGMADQIPFGPFLLFGAAVALGWGDEVIDWYLKLVG